MNISSPEVNELFTALAKAQGELAGATKDSSNPFFKSKYADLESCWDACRLPLSKNGLSVVQVTNITESGHMILVTTLAHSSGQFVNGFYKLEPVKNDPQGMGSAITYARRYALAAIVGLYQTDDDGNQASGKVSQQAPEIKSVSTNTNKPTEVMNALGGTVSYQDTCDSCQGKMMISKMNPSNYYCLKCKTSKPRT